MLLVRSATILSLEFGALHSAQKHACEQRASDPSCDRRADRSEEVHVAAIRPSDCSPSSAKDHRSRCSTRLLDQHTIRTGRLVPQSKREQYKEKEEVHDCSADI